MSPAASNGPPHSRSTSVVNVGGPISTETGTKLNGNGIATAKGSPRVFPHLDDLISARPNVDINRPLRKILQDGELSAKQADTYMDFQRLDLAIQEYMKAKVLATEIIPRHKDYPSLQAERGELHRAYTGLMKRTQAQSAKVDTIIEVIKENNARSGVQPQQRAEPDEQVSGERVKGHARAQSLQSPALNGTSRISANGYGHSEHSNGIPETSALVPTSANGSPVRKKPPVQPKPQALHGKSLHPGGDGTALKSPQMDLEARFARLRSPNSTPGQDPRIRTQPISVPESPRASRQPIATTKSSSTIRPSGPREMPSAPTSALRPSRVSIDVQIPGMPRPPDAIYSPDRNTESLVALNLPTSVPRSSSYLGTSSQTSAPPISTVGPTPSITDARKDYFSLPVDADSPGSSHNISKGQDPVVAEVTAVSAEGLMKYLGMGSQALRLLVVDLRSREEFDAGHIMAQSVICVEPVSLRKGMSAEELGESIVLSPDTEQKLYEQRHEFDLIVFYDQSSSSINQTHQIHESSNHLQYFAEAIFDYGYSKRPKQRPMLLLGGLDAWVDLMGPGSLQTSSTGVLSSTGIRRKPLKPARPLGRVPMARKDQALARKPQESRPLSREEENQWAETLREDTHVKNPGAENSESDEFSYVRTTEDFFRRYPELPSVQESMVSTRPSTSMNKHHNESANAMPGPPARPAPALPRQRSSGISERGPSATYSMSSGTGPETITSTPVPPGLTGLDTTGVSCYANAVLQCLSATKPFRDFLISYNYPTYPLPPRKGAEISDPPQLLTRNLKKVFGFLWCGQYEWITPKTFWGYVNALHAKTLPPMTDKGNAFCGPNLQHDSQEFLGYIFDLMIDELNFYRNQTPYSEIHYTDAELDARNKLPALQAAHEQWQLFQSTDNSMVSDIFGGLETNENTCQMCGYVSKRWSLFQILNIPFPPSCHGYNPLDTIKLERLFEHRYNRKEVLEDVECQGCKRKGKVIRIDKICFLPDYLVINLPRFDADVLSKVKTRVLFSEMDIDITRFWLPDVGQSTVPNVGRGLQPPFRYDCYAAVAHMGSDIKSGHYLAFARSPDKPSSGAGSWHCFSDKKVRKTTWEQIQDQHLTILFLKRRKT